MAHYMVCCSPLGADTTITDYRAEIIAARKAGIDGFALNVGAWEKQPYYKRAVRALFDAAEEVPGFRLVLSIDVSSGLSVAEATNMVEEFHSRPSYLSVNGRPVVTTYSGDRDWIDGLRNQLSIEGINIFSVPYFDYPRKFLGPFSNPLSRDVSIFSAAVQQNPALNGFFYFGAAWDGTVLADIIRQIVPIAHGQNKLALVGISPYYRGLSRNYRVFESRGFEGMAAQWLAAIDTNADWVELVTWNDWVESSYLAPTGSVSTNSIASGRWGNILSHDAFLEASRYYIDWFKSGHPPPITDERVFYFYRTHLKSAMGYKSFMPNLPGRPKGADLLADNVFVTSFLRERARLSVVSGAKTYDLNLEAGVQNVAVPLAVGGVSFSLSRNGVTIAKKDGELPVDIDGSLGNFNVFSGTLLGKQ